MKYVASGSYVVNPAADNFWEVYDWFQKEFDDYHGGEAGIVDLNRYYYLAFEEGGGQ